MTEKEFWAIVLADLNERFLFEEEMLYTDGWVTKALHNLLIEETS